MLDYGVTNEDLLRALGAQNRQQMGGPDLSGYGNLGLEGHEQRDTDNILNQMGPSQPAPMPEPFQFNSPSGEPYQSQPGRQNIHELIQRFFRSLIFIKFK